MGVGGDPRREPRWCGSGPAEGEPGRHRHGHGRGRGTACTRCAAAGVPRLGHRRRGVRRRGGHVRRRTALGDRPRRRNDQLRARTRLVLLLPGPRGTGRLPVARSGGGPVARRGLHGGAGQGRPPERNIDPRGGPHHAHGPCLPDGVGGPRALAGPRRAPRAAVRTALHGPRDGLDRTVPGPGGGLPGDGCRDRRVPPGGRPARPPHRDGGGRGRHASTPLVRRARLLVAPQAAAEAGKLWRTTVGAA